MLLTGSVGVTKEDGRSISGRRAANRMLTWSALDCGRLREGDNFVGSHRDRRSAPRKRGCSLKLSTVMLHRSRPANRREAITRRNMGWRTTARCACGCTSTEVVVRSRRDGCPPCRPVGKQDPPTLTVCWSHGIEENVTPPDVNATRVARRLGLRIPPSRIAACLSRVTHQSQKGQAWVCRVTGPKFSAPRVVIVLH